MNKSSQAYTSLAMIHWGHQNVIRKPKKDQLKVSDWRLLTIFYPWINARTQEDKSSSAIALAANIYSPKRSQEETTAMKQKQVRNHYISKLLVSPYNQHKEKFVETSGICSFIYDVIIYNWIWIQFCYDDVVRTPCLSVTSEHYTCHIFTWMLMK